jgi:hypothetical protein
MLGSQALLKKGKGPQGHMPHARPGRQENWLTKPCLYESPYP